MGESERARTKDSTVSSLILLLSIVFVLSCSPSHRPDRLPTMSVPRTIYKEHEGDKEEREREEIIRRMGEEKNGKKENAKKEEHEKT